MWESVFVWQTSQFPFRGILLLLARCLFNRIKINALIILSFRHRSESVPDKSFSERCPKSTFLWFYLIAKSDISKNIPIYEICQICLKFNPRPKFQNTHGGKTPTNFSFWRSWYGIEKHQQISLFFNQTTTYVIKAERKVLNNLTKY